MLRLRSVHREDDLVVEDLAPDVVNEDERPEHEVEHCGDESARAPRLEIAHKTQKPGHYEAKHEDQDDFQQFGQLLETLCGRGLVRELRDADRKDRAFALP